MSEQDIELEDSQTLQDDNLSAGDETTNEPTREELLERDLQAERERSARLEDQNKKLYARAKSAETKEKNLNRESSDYSPEPSQDNEWKERIELRVDGYSDKEVDFIIRNGGKAALNDGMVKTAIKVAREEARSKEATPGSSNRSFVHKKYTLADFSNMSASEMEKALNS